MKIFLIFLLLLSINEIEAGKIKEEKSFDEIFDQKWDERKEENICRIDQIIHGATDDQNNQIGQNGQQFNQVFDQILEVKDEEKSEEMSINSDQLVQLSRSNGHICDQNQILNDKQKKEIVEKFHKIKEKIKQKGKKYSKKEWNKIERKIAKKLGTNKEKIYEWKRKFGLNINKYSEEEKRKIIKHFDQIYAKIKNKLKEKLKGKRTKYQKIIAKHLGINIRNIKRWKKEIKNGKFVKKQENTEQKREIIDNYLKIKNEFMQIGKHSRKEWKEFRAKINHIFGVDTVTIERWAKKIGIMQNVFKEQKMLAIAEKMEMMKQYYQMKKQTPKLSDEKIAEILKISSSSLSRFKVAFKEENVEMF